MATFIPNARQQFTDANGAPLAGGSVGMYVPSTLTPSATWQDAGQTTLNPNPIPLDMGGFATIYGGGSYRQIVKDALGNTVFDRVVADSLLPNFMQAGAGAKSRTQQDKLRDTVSVKDFGAKGDGSTDDLAAFNAAVLAIKTAGGGMLLVPDGTYILSAPLVLPYDLFYFSMCGFGRKTILRAKAGVAAFDLITWAPPVTGGYVYHEISGFNLDGNNLTGAGSLINTKGLGGIRMLRLYLVNISATGAGIFTNGVGTTYNHDVVIDDIYIEQGTPGGQYGIYVGPLASDSYINNVTVQGRGNLAYGIYFAAGAAHIRLSNSHSYNCSTAQIAVNSNADALWFSDVTTDAGTAAAYNFYASGMTNCTFTNCQFTYSYGNTDLVTLINSTDNVFIGTNFEGLNPGTRWGINESGTSDRNVFNGYTVNGSFVSGIATLVGASSAIRKLGVDTVLMGNTNIAAGNTFYVGSGAGSTTSALAQAHVPYNGFLRKLLISTGNAPGAAQTLVGTINQNGTDIGTFTATISGASSYIATTLGLLAVTAGDTLSAKLVNSAGAAANQVRVLMVINH